MIVPQSLCPSLLLEKAGGGGGGPGGGGGGRGGGGGGGGTKKKELLEGRNTKSHCIGMRRLIDFANRIFIVCKLFV